MMCFESASEYVCVFFFRFPFDFLSQLMRLNQQMTNKQKSVHTDMITSSPASQCDVIVKFSVQTSEMKQTP